MKYFLDTYALVEILHDNPLYQKYKEEELQTTLFNLYELYFSLLKTYNTEIAKVMFYKFFESCIEINEEHIFAAAAFKLEHKKTNISYVDALGYAIAKKEGMRFLTGDKEFKEIPNVEFVTKHLYR